ncbi:MAG: type II toxin-antitoxin system VapC family toxin [Acidobacteria bacterium]|nr:type II toxin-antitoxin system VapC family toxin [Acidobacteriota bacterium]
MNRICLDTSAYSHFRRGDSSVVEMIGRARWVGIPSVVLGELRTGFLLGRQAAKNEDELRQFLHHPLVEVLDVDDDAARIYADIMVALRKAGTPVPTNDIWVAAVSARDGATVLTYDEHFRLIHRVGSTILSG